MNTNTDNPIERRNLLELSDDELDKMVEDRRVRRFEARRRYEEQRKQSIELLNEKNQKQIEKKVEQAEKALTRIDKANDEFEKRILEIRALRMQIEDEMDG